MTEMWERSKQANSKCACLAKFAENSSSILVTDFACAEGTVLFC